MSQQAHQSDPPVLNRRTLERDHRRLAVLLRPGMAVLDVGCGTGAITAGIARKVGPQGRVVGVDRDDSLLAIARREHQDVPNLTVENADAVSLDFEDSFDIVSASRVLQWVGDPALAVQGMKRAARRGGSIVALDYNHPDNTWEPGAPAEFMRFYAAFLDWRTGNGWDNRIADRLPDLFHAAGIADVRTHLNDEVVERGDPDFDAATAIWAHVIDTVGPRIVAAGFLSEPERLNAAERYRDYLRAGLRKQTLCLRTVEGRKP